KRCHAVRASLLDQTLSRCASQLIGSNAVTLREPAYWIKRCHVARASLLNKTLSRRARQLIYKKGCRAAALFV
ncbi:hypothetical protein, partial [Parablautia intestinalis]|uniref:hypothetical protein n=1 Tax=Parablautia intestinalis TaxID=2320100 RepID=UPI00256F19F9